MSAYRSRDHAAFCRAGFGDRYDAAGNLNLFMQCEALNQAAFRELPAGYAFRLCRRDELDVWKRTAAEEQYVDAVTDFYDRVYEERADDFFRRCLFVCGAGDRLVATCFLWRTYGRIDTVAWFRVLRAYEGLGIGRALLGKVLADARYPVYLHTQPTSARAIKLYSDFGFGLITDPVVGNRKNDVCESLPFLRSVLPETDFQNLRFVKADGGLLAAASASEFAEF